MSDLIPKALMVNIWIRLPIRSAVRFRCVSKSWCSTLSDSDLITKNLTFSDPKNDYPHDLLLFVRGQYSVVSYETLQVSPIHPDPQLDVYARVLSSCDGLICCYEHYGVDVGVWNPATGETKIPASHHVDGDFETIGFGFDAKNNDYKIVKIFSVWKHDKIIMEAFVHSLRSNCWRKLEEPNISVSPNGFYPRRYSSYPIVQAYRDGTFYWLADGCSIVSFDMSDEVFKSIRIPKDPSLYIDSFFWFRDGSLGISTHKREEYQDEKSVFQIWALLDAGVAQSWTPLLTIDDTWVSGLDQCLGFWRNEYLFRACTNQIIMCDPFKRETKAINIEGDEYEDLGFPIRYRASHKPLSPYLIPSQMDD